MFLSHMLSLFGVVLVLVTLPLLVELLALTAAAMLPATGQKARLAASEKLPIVVLVPAHNEEALIGRCIRSVLFSADSRLAVQQGDGRLRGTVGEIEHGQRIERHPHWGGREGSGQE